VTADLAARIHIQNMKGFNGYHGCFYCKILGEFIAEKRHIYFPSDTTALKRISAELPIHYKNV